MAKVILRPRRPSSSSFARIYRERDYRGEELILRCMQIVCFISCFSLALFRSPLGLIANIKGDRATQTPLLQSLHGKKANLRQDALFIFIKLVSVHKGLVPFVHGEQKSVCSPFQLGWKESLFTSRRFALKEIAKSRERR